jgi:predicted phosphodiesterase
MKAFALKVKIPSRFDNLQLEPIGDTHVDDINFVEPKLKEVIERIRTEPNRYTIGMGDYASAIYTNAAERRSAMTIRPEFKDNPVASYGWLATQLEPIKKKILLMLLGNHDYAVEKLGHINPVEELLCKRLGVPYGGYVSLVSLTVTNGKHERNWRLYLTHGKFGGGLPANSLSKLERMAQSFEADVYLAGDRHEIVSDKRPIITIDEKGQIVKFDRIYGITGCFVEGYDDKGYTSFPEMIMGSANRVGTLTVQFQLTNGKVYIHA